MAAACCEVWALLADNGQPDDAIAVLRQPGCTAGGNRTVLAMLLAQQGRVEEAITVSHVRYGPLRLKTRLAPPSPRARPPRLLPGRHDAGAPSPLGP